jgi:hypothetical protein
MALGSMPWNCLASSVQPRPRAQPSRAVLNSRPVSLPFRGCLQRAMDGGGKRPRLGSGRQSPSALRAITWKKFSFACRIDSPTRFTVDGVNGKPAPKMTRLASCRSPSDRLISRREPGCSGPSGTRFEIGDQLTTDARERLGGLPRARRDQEAEAANAGLRVLRRASHLPSHLCYLPVSPERSKVADFCEGIVKPRHFGGLAGGPGFEPRMPGSEPGVLPLNYPPSAGGRGN